MPEVFRFFGFSFFFYSREHEPIHIHVRGGGGEAIYDIVNGEIIQREVVNIKANDLRRIKQVIEINKVIIIEEWERYFGKEALDEEDK